MGSQDPPPNADQLAGGAAAGSGGGAGRGGLLGREAELGAIAAGIGRVREGDGALLAVEGVAGIGKTALVGAALEAGRADRSRGLLAACTPLEAAFPFGAVRQLLDPVRRELGEDAWAALSGGAARHAAPALADEALVEGGAGDDPSFAVLHGLYWLVANLAERGPLILAVDDAHWADRPSLRFLAHLARRLDGVPALVLVCVRTGDPQAERLLVSELFSAAHRTIALAPLGESEAAELVRLELGAAEESLCAACHRVTGGNPFLLRALVEAIASGDVSPSAEAVDALRGVRVEAVVRSLLRRLAPLSEDSRRLVCAAAVAGGSASPVEVAELAGLDGAGAGRAAAALREAGILAPGPSIGFVHPLVRASVYEGMPADERRALHRSAARMALRRGAPAERAAVHYVAIEGSGDPDAVAVLREAARAASRRGAPEMASSYLRRALSEPPPHELRPRLLFELGLAGIAAEEPGSARRLVEAVDEISDPGERAEAALEAAVPLAFNANSMDVVSVCAAGLASRGSIDPGLATKLEVEQALSGFLDPSTVATSTQWVESKRGDEDPLVAPAATVGSAWVRLAIEGRPAPAELERLVDMVADGSLFSRPSGVLAQGAVWVLVLGGRPDLARGVGEAVVAMGEHEGSALIASVGRFWRAVAELELGLVAAAVADSQAAAEVALEGAGDAEGLSYILSTLLDSLVEAGELDRAERTLAEASAPREGDGRHRVRLPDRLPSRTGFAFLLEARGRLRAAQGRDAEASSDLLEAGRRWRELAVMSPVASSWRGDAALALDRLGRSEQASRLASEQLELARRSEQPRAIGTSLRALGELEGGDPGLASLTEAVGLLEQTPARLELGKALLALGGVLRRAGERRAAREPLARALDLAHRAGAGATAESAGAELRLAGARPRRRALSGADSLTAAERTVAELAAGGASNKAIAQRAFVSLRTVETHLTHAYRKLGIASREELAGALRPDPRPTPR